MIGLAHKTTFLIDRHAIFRSKLFQKFGIAVHTTALKLKN